MKIKQLSLFLENKPGHLNTICRTLAEKQINIITLSLADTQQFGIMRLIIQDWQHARDVLTEAGFVVNVRDVIAAEVPDRPGGMSAILETLSKENINIEYMYAFATHCNDNAVIVMRFDDADKAASILHAAGHTTIDAKTLFHNIKENSK